nr:hypothetical protein [Anaerolineae bacterium]
MATVLPIHAALKELPELIRRLEPGEVITLTEADGTPRAVLVVVGQAVQRSKGLSAKNSEAWWAHWDALASRIGRAWKSGRSAVEAVQEIRR